MKFKLKNKDELVAVYYTISAMTAKLAEEATRPTAAGERPHIRMAARLVAVELQKLCITLANKAMMPTTDKPSIKFNASAGLSMLSAWYALDAMEINDPLSYALLTDITDRLEKAFGAPLITQHS